MVSVDLNSDGLANIAGADGVDLDPRRGSVRVVAAPARPWGEAWAAVSSDDRHADTPPMRGPSGDDRADRPRDERRRARAVRFRRL